ncbi:putative protein phosphatase 2C 52 [Hibiscus syriacus]|uniref:protein-serine/threonine phosphatase n=1 Tax=Hibiscus syriacus TaxID=106335 RepID=A0A6A2YEP9_HIBSY|nr:probable protein phosphatase 2C 52 [Hibiscus syriacus]KAE8672927.1 putative protein phosphatase 2C 52 [Hibiscus syriacus]
MGCCVSTSSRSTCSSGSHGEARIGFRVTKGTSRTISDHVIPLQNLPSVPNRIFANGKSRNSCIFTQQGRKGINQDAMIVWEDFMSEDVTFCGVFDGHGPQGHLVAHEVRDALPLKLLSSMHSYQSRQHESEGSCFKGNSKKSDGRDPDKNIFAEDRSKFSWREAFMKSYKAMDKELRSHPDLDCFCSGSTAVTIIKQGPSLFMGYIGDSRAIMGSKDSNGSMVAIQLTVDLKPDLPKEAERIKKCKGRVFAMQDEPEVHRVWLPFDDAPGLAMARAFGDFCLKEYGVISMPEFSHRLLTDSDQFIVLASDGVWDVLSNEEVVQIVSLAPTRSSAARALVDSAAGQWKLKYPTSKMDDCTAVCLFLDGKMEYDNEEQGYSSATLQSNHSGNAVDDGYGRLVAAEFEGNVVAVLTEDQKWLGLEGVTRVNSLVQLPRFSEEDQTFEFASSGNQTGLIFL